LSHYIEEDFRYATVAEVENYTPEELVWKPHMCGFEFGQLLDQINEKIITRLVEGRKFQILLRAPGGTALWIAKHLLGRGIDILVITETEYTTPLSMKGLRSLPNVCDAMTADRASREYEDFATDCIVLAYKDTLPGRFIPSTRTPHTRWASLIAYDPHRDLTRYAGLGHYFMNSSVWVREGT